MRPEVCARIPAVAHQRKACNRCNHFVDRAPTTLSKMLSSTRPRDGRGVEGQRRRFERAKNGLNPIALAWAGSSSGCRIRHAPSVASSVAVRSIASPPQIANDDEKFLPLNVHPRSFLECLRVCDERIEAPSTTRRDSERGRSTAHGACGQQVNPPVSALSVTQTVDHRPHLEW